MGVYSIKEQTTVSLEGAGIVECQYDNMLEAALNIVAESQYNYGQIMKSIGIEELCVFESTGEEMVYEAAQTDGFFAKIKEFFMGIWEKIKGLFKKFFAMFDSFTKSDKEFATKYKADLLKINHSLTDFKYKGFKFSNIDTVAELDASTASNKAEVRVVAMDKIASTTKAEVLEIKKNREDMEEQYDKLRGLLLKSSGGSSDSPLSASEFSKEMFMLLRSGEENKEELENPNVSEILSELLNSAKLKTAADKAMRSLEKLIQDNIKSFDKARTEIIKLMPDKSSAGMANAADGITNSEGVMVASYRYSIAQATLNIAQSANGALLTAIKDQARQNKSICVSLLSYKPKKENADVQSTQQESSSFLSGVKLK